MHPLAALVLSARVAGADVDTPPTDRDLFDGGTLQSIELVINPRDWDELRANYQLNTYYACHFVWRNQVVRNVGIRSRGNGSRNGAKPGLRVDFNMFDASQQFLGLKSLVLRNNTQDPSHLHERIGMRLFGRMGLAAPRQAHTRLYVNGQYAGLYSIVEAVDKVFLGKHFGENNGHLYEYDYEPDDKPYRFEFRGPSPALYSPKPFKPVTHELDPDPAPIVEMVRAINETPRPDFERVVGAYLALDRLVVQLAVESFLSEMDGVLGEWGMNNFYLYRFERSTTSTLIPWDKSEAFKGGVERSIWHNVDDVPSWIQNQLAARVMLVPRLRTLYRDALLRCAEIASATDGNQDAAEGGAQEEGSSEGEGRVADDHPGWLEREVLEAFAQIRAAVHEDETKPYTNDEFEEAVRQLVEFARHRSDIVRRDVERSAW
jgi:hypothetical protein